MRQSLLTRILQSAKRSWLGEEKLRIVFWGWFILSLIFFLILHILVQPFVHSLIDPVDPKNVNLFFIVDTVLSTGPRLLLIVVIWRCARNSNKPIWFYLARMFTALYLLSLIAADIYQFAKLTGEKEYISNQTIGTKKVLK